LSTGPHTAPRSESLTAVEVLPILLVDDRVANLRALEAVLESLGHPLLSATSGAEALRLLLEHEVALILLDVRMPNLNGLETAQLIKGRERTREVPIVFMTASPDELEDVIRGYDIGALDYLLKPVDPDLLRTKVAVFVELEASRRALQHSEALLRGAFEAAPIGKTVLDSRGRIVRANPAFARLLGRGDPTELQGTPVTELAHGDDREELSAVLARLAGESGGPEAESVGPVSADVILRTLSGREVLVEAVASTVSTREQDEPSLLIQWVDLTTRRRAEQARAELLLEQAARSQAERDADRMRTLQTITDALDSATLGQLLAELVHRLAELFSAEAAEVKIDGEDQPVVVRVVGGRVDHVSVREPAPAGVRWEEVRLAIHRTHPGVLRLGLAPDRRLSADEDSLLSEVAERAALAIRRVQLREQEHRIAEELQRGLLPKRLPEMSGVELVAHYQVAGLVAEAGGDWYDAFALPDGRLGVVVGDVTGRGVRAASTMGQMRSVTRAYALADDGARGPGEVLTRVNRYQLKGGEDELFTMVYAVIDPVGGRLWYANAGHPPPVVRGPASEARMLGNGGGLMGVLDSVYEEFEEPLAAGDVLILYSDGLVERRGESIDVGLGRLVDAARSGPDDAQALCAHLLREVLPGSAGLHDDVTALLARIES
jgi:PAS domain S-box-containing protein